MSSAALHVTSEAIGINNNNRWVTTTTVLLPTTTFTIHIPPPSTSIITSSGAGCVCNVHSLPDLPVEQLCQEALQCGLLTGCGRQTWQLISVAHHRRSQQIVFRRRHVGGFWRVGGGTREREREIGEEGCGIFCSIDDEKERQFAMEFIDCCCCCCRDRSFLDSKTIFCNNGFGGYFAFFLPRITTIEKKNNNNNPFLALKSLRWGS